MTLRDLLPIQLPPRTDLHLLPSGRWACYHYDNRYAYGFCMRPQMRDHVYPKRVLDLFCGGGGAAMGLHQAWPGAEIVGFDINRQPSYPFTFYQDDVAQFTDFDIFEERFGRFDFAWSSPPCQVHTRKSANWGRKRTYFYDHRDLIPRTREILEASKLPYVIENVVGAPLRKDIILCGSMFGLKIRKHRIFEANFKLEVPSQSCNHQGLYNPWQGKGRSADKLRDALGIDWLPISGGASRKVGYTGDLFNAIPPAYSRYIAEQYSLSRIIGPSWSEMENAVIGKLIQAGWNEAEWEADRALRIEHSAKFHASGHDTEDEAIVCYREFLRIFGKSEL